MCPWSLPKRLHMSATGRGGEKGDTIITSRSPCCVLLALSWNTNEYPRTDKLSRAITYIITILFVLILESRPHPHTHPHPDPHPDPHPLTRWEASAKASAAHVTSLVRGNVLQICAKREEGKGQPSTVGLHKKFRTNPGFDCKNSISEHIILFENILDFVTKKTLTRRCLDLFDKQYQVVR